MSEHRNGGAAVVETLAAHGVNAIFGIPGTHNLELYRHFGKAGIRAITPRHEQGAGYAAEAYARVKKSFVRMHLDGSADGPESWSPPADPP